MVWALWQCNPARDPVLADPRFFAPSHSSITPSPIITFILILIVLLIFILFILITAGCDERAGIRSEGCCFFRGKT
jgi:hypothetical protein